MRIYASHVSAISADREVQRILLELLNQMDGFDVSVNVKVGKLFSMTSATQNTA